MALQAQLSMFPRDPEAPRDAIWPSPWERAESEGPRSQCLIQPGSQLPSPRQEPVTLLHWRVQGSWARGFHLDASCILPPGALEASMCSHQLSPPRSTSRFLQVFNAGPQSGGVPRPGSNETVFPGHAMWQVHAPGWAAGRQMSLWIRRAEGGFLKV